jgi:hypothetical protein
MKLSNFIASLWLFPVILQVLLPHFILCGWSVIKVPSLLLGHLDPTIPAERPIASRRRNLGSHFNPFYYLMEGSLRIAPSWLF